jgi:hypothetical protein
MIGNPEFGDFPGRINPNKINNIRFENGHAPPLSTVRMGVHIMDAATSGIVRVKAIISHLRYSLS